MIKKIKLFVCLVSLTTLGCKKKEINPNVASESKSKKTAQEKVVETSSSSSSSTSSSSSGSYSSSPSTPPKPIINPLIPLVPAQSTMDLGIDPDINDVTFENNVLTTPLFKLTYEYDTKVVSERWQKTDDEKKRFLLDQYQKFVDQATFSNEIYSLKEIIFTQLTNNNQPRGRYWSKQKKIQIKFQYNNPEETTSIFLHEYYHHLIDWRMEQPFYNEFKYIPGFHSLNDINKPRPGDIDTTKYKEFWKLFNGGIDQVEKNWKKIRDLTSTEVYYLRGLTYEYEIRQYYDHYFSKLNPQQLISFSRDDLAQGILKNGGRLNLAGFSYYHYVGEEVELPAQMMNLYTNKSSLRLNNLTRPNNNELNFYLLHLFWKTNIYYSYQSLNRKYPTNFINREINSWIESENHLPWSDVSGFAPENQEVMEQKYQKWRDYFENLLFNQDQLLANAFMDDHQNLYLELSKKDQVITFENITNNQVITPNVTLMPNYGQVTFNLKPYHNGQKTKLANWAYKIAKGQLSPGTYKIKINGADLKSNQGLDIIKRHNGYQKVYSLKDDYFSQLDYKFFIQDELILVEVY